MNAPKKQRQCGWENGTGHQMPKEMFRSLHETARYTKIHITFNVLTSEKLQYLQPFCPGGARQTSLYVT